MCRESVRPPRLWRIAEGQHPDWRCWNGIYVVFNSISGTTHTLDIASGSVLLRLMDGPMSFRTRRTELGASLEVDDTRGLSEALETILRQLDEIGLIEPAC